MKKLLALLAALAALAAPSVAAAHPLGNFTINRFSRIQPSGNRIYVLYVLDLAEIPTFQAKGLVQREGERAYGRRTAAEIARKLELKVDGAPVRLQPIRRVLAFPPGVAGLRTTRLEIVLSTPPISVRTSGVRYRDRNFAGRIGWSEIVVRAGQNATVRSASVPSRTISEELLSYPKDLLESPLDVTEVQTRVELGAGPGVAPSLRSAKVLEQRATVRASSDGGFAGLIREREMSTGFVLLALAIAIFWGAAHGLGPGHGKAIVAAYLIGQRGTARHAVYLGGIVTVTHTIGVFGLGLVTLLLSEFIVPEDLYPWLNLVAGLAVLGVGVAVLRGRLHHRLAHAFGRDRRDREHEHHDHDHDHGHSHAPPEQLSARSLLAVGVSGGILPCPSALVVLLAAISLHRVGFGMLLVLAFSVGLALTITAIGLVAVLAKHAFGRMGLNGRLVQLLPAVSATAIVLVGAIMTARALPKVNL